MWPPVPTAGASFPFSHPARLPPPPDSHPLLLQDVKACHPPPLSGLVRPRGLRASQRPVIPPLLLMAPSSSSQPWCCHRPSHPGQRRLLYLQNPRLTHHRRDATGHSTALRCMHSMHNGAQSPSPQGTDAGKHHPPLTRPHQPLSFSPEARALSGEACFLGNLRRGRELIPISQGRTEVTEVTQGWRRRARGQR